MCILVVNIRLINIYKMWEHRIMLINLEINAFAKKLVFMIQYLSITHSVCNISSQVINQFSLN